MVFKTLREQNYRRGLVRRLAAYMSAEIKRLELMQMRTEDRWPIMLESIADFIIEERKSNQK